MTCTCFFVTELNVNWKKLFYEKVYKMSSIDEQILKSAKEIVVKFIEAGRLSPNGFDETFKNIYYTIEEAVQGSREKPEEYNE
ncbi:MAG: hypothetical protein DRH21_07515 [Deltaproteobacteria bacterium]|nr:MAG: hypothetical protein DRH21_07515 [Deltaproteobacteria bacterium]